MRIDKENYPYLFREYIPPEGNLRMVFELGSKFPDDLIGVVKMVATVGDQYLITRGADGWWEPGGKPEPGESYRAAIDREMREEAGAVVKDFTLFGAFHCFSLQDEPPEAGLLWPEWYFLWGYGEVEMVGQPSLTEEEKEHMLEVRLFSLEETCRRFSDTPGAGPWMVEIYRLAAALRREDSNE